MIHRALARTALCFSPPRPGCSATCADGFDGGLTVFFRPRTATASIAEHLRRHLRGMRTGRILAGEIRIGTKRDGISKIEASGQHQARRGGNAGDRQPRRRLGQRRARGTRLVPRPAAFCIRWPHVGSAGEGRGGECPSQLSGRSRSGRLCVGFSATEQSCLCERRPKPGSISDP
jgi:hypothetical protein